MRYVISFLCVVILFFENCNYSNRRNNTVEVKSDVEGVELDPKVMRDKDKPAVELFIDSFADSINNIKETELPYFLQDTRFDYHYVGIFSPFHNPTPFRKLIFDKISNCNALKLIINSEMVSIKSKPRVEHGIHVKFEEFSYYDLAVKRMKQLGCL